MRTFTLVLLGATQTRRIDDVVGFVGEDASGSFGILANRRSLLTILNWGLCRYRTADDRVHYVALPGGVLAFRNNQLTVATRSYLCDDDYAKLGVRLTEDLAAEERARKTFNDLLRRVEHELLKQLLKQDA